MLHELRVYTLKPGTAAAAADTAATLGKARTGVAEPAWLLPTRTLPRLGVLEALP